MVFLKWGGAGGDAHYALRLQYFDVWENEWMHKISLASMCHSQGHVQEKKYFFHFLDISHAFIKDTMKPLTTVYFY